MLYSELTPQYSLELNRWRPEELFDFDFMAPDDFKNRFVYLFYQMYADRQIGTTNFIRFKQWVRSIYYNKLDKYLKLLESTTMIDTPFLTTEMEHYNADKEKRKSKLYGDYKSHTWDNAQANTNAASFDNTMSQTESLNTQAILNDMIEKDKETHNQKEDQTEDITKRAWFADTPQSEMKAGGNAEDDKLFNGGYLTTYGKDQSNRDTYTYSEGGSGSVKDKWDKTDSIGGESSAGSNTNFNTGSTTSASSGDSTGKTNTTQTTGSILENKQTRKRKGYEGVQKSDIVLRYRETLINAIEEFLEEFDDCFMQIF